MVPASFQAESGSKTNMSLSLGVWHISDSICVEGSDEDMHVS